MIDSSLLTAFSAVVREGSFEKAAQKLHVTPSAISQKVKHLETRLGSILLTRGRPCVPTEIGFQIFRHAESINLLENDLLDLLPSTVRSTTVDAPITLRIAVNADSVGTWFIAALSKFTANHNCLFDLVIDDQDYTSDMLRQGNVLAAISAIDKPIQGFKNLPIGALRYTAISSPGFFKKHFSKNGVNLNSLRLASYIVFNQKDQLHQKWLISTFDVNNIDQSHRIPSYDGYINACLEGLGWGLHPRLSLQEYITDGSLIELVPNSDIDEPLYWQYSETSGALMLELTKVIEQVAKFTFSQQQ